jgi:hypothetical protein
MNFAVYLLFDHSIKFLCGNSLTGVTFGWLVATFGWLHTGVTFGNGVVILHFQKLMFPFGFLFTMEQEEELKRDSINVFNKIN